MWYLAGGPHCNIELEQSTSYWRGEARPFAILEHSVTTAGVATVNMYILQLDDMTGTFTITNLTVGSGYNATSTSFEPGQHLTFTITGATAGSQTAGNTYDLQVTISYTIPDGQERVFVGARPIVGKYVTNDSDYIFALR